MIPFTVKDCAGAVNGTIHGADPDAIVTAVVTDSRLAGAGALFVALAGDHADGHDFAADAAARGAVAMLASRDVPAPAIVVDDTLVALRALAEAVRARLRATVVAITGSSGKTCTKDFTAAAIAAERRVVASEASHNNEIGVPLTILAARDDTEVLVVEVGSRGIGHIEALMPAVRPDISVVTNVGPAHVGMFGSLESTALAKGELVEALPPDGIAVLNADDPAVAAMAERTRAEVVTFGRGDGAMVQATDVTLDEGACASFTLGMDRHEVRVTLAVPGEHMVSNALAAAAAARACGVSLDGIARGLGAVAAPKWRMEVRELAGGVRVLNDAYNANPDSMAAALKTLVAMGRGRPTWAVLGHMAELGESAVREHDRIGRLAVRLRVGHLVTVGDEARAIHEAARLEGFFESGDAVFVADADQAVSVLRAGLEPGAVVLVKASRAGGLERIVEALEAGP